MSLSWTRAIQGPALLHRMLCKGKQNPKVFKQIFTGSRRRMTTDSHSNCVVDSWFATNLPSSWNLRQGGDAPDAGGDAKLAVCSVRFHAHDRGLAQHPALFAVG